MYSERFNKAYNALVRAFFNGTLAGGDCAKCAVGNMVAANLGYSGTWLANWRDVFLTTRGEQRILPHNYIGGAKYEIDSTGYSWQELAKIEFAFEQNTQLDGSHSSEDYETHTEQEILEDQYNGLCAVVDVLLSFEENNTGNEILKSKFRQHPKLVV